MFSKFNFEVFEVSKNFSAARVFGKLPLFLVVGFLSASLFFVACEKDSQLPEAAKPVNNISVNDRSENKDADEAEAMYIAEIQNFIATVKVWRVSNATATMNAQEVVSKTEVAFNYNLADVTSVFEQYDTYESIIEMPAASGTWDAKAVVDFYDAVKGKVGDELNESPDRTLRLLVLGVPVIHNGKALVDIMVMTGIKKLPEIVPFNSVNDIRWTAAPIGFTQNTICGSSANDIIGAFANNQIGVFQGINAGPGSGGNTPLPGRVVSNILRGEHNLFGATFPSGSNFGPAYPSVATFGTNKQSLHYNSIAFVPNVPQENCLSIPQLVAFQNGNITLGNSMLSVVPKVQLGPFLLPRRLVATAVGAAVLTASIPPPNSPIANAQEHATRHFYGRVSFVIQEEEICCLSEM